jgi:hypothetical protein
MNPWILGNYGAKRLMCDIRVELLMGHHLNHILNVESKFTRPLRVGGYVRKLIHNVLKHMKPLMLHDHIK